MLLNEPELSAKTLRIMVADDHEVVRRGVKALLENQPGWKVVAEAENGRQAVERAEHLRPDIAIVDISMPEVDGLSAARQLRQMCSDIEVLVLTYHDSPQMVRKAFETGARGYVLKSDAGFDLVAAVEAVRQHKSFVSPRLSGGQSQRNHPQTA
jgi:DNA-binding NarL/FixJ family response regulator